MVIHKINLFGAILNFIYFQNIFAMEQLNTPQYMQINQQKSIEAYKQPLAQFQNQNIRGINAPQNKSNFIVSISITNLHHSDGCSKFLAKQMQSQIDHLYFKQCLQDPLMNVKLNSKMVTIDQKIDSAMSIINECPKTTVDNFTYERQFILKDLYIPEAPKLDNALQLAKFDIEQIMFNSKGEFKGVSTNTEVQKIEKIVENFQNAVNQWKSENYTSLAYSVINEINNPLEPQQYPCRPYNVDFDSKVQSNAFNQDISKVINDCKNGDFDAAANIVGKYEAQASKLGYIQDNEDFKRYSIISKIYGDRFRAHFNNYGIAHRYTQDPCYKVRESSLPKPTSIPRPNKELNALLGARESLRQDMLLPLEISNPSAQINETLYELISSAQDHGPLAIVEHLATNINKDGQNSHLYPTFYHDNGLPKFYAYNEPLINSITIESTIGISKHEQERISLYKLASIDTTGLPAAESAVRQGIEYINLACLDGPLAKNYSQLAQAVANAAYYKESDPTILECSNFATEAIKPLHQKIQNDLVPFVSSITKTLNSTIDPKKKQELRTTLRNLDQLWRASVNHNFEKAENLLVKILQKTAPAQEKLFVQPDAALSLDLVSTSQHSSQDQIFDAKIFEEIMHDTNLEHEFQNILTKELPEKLTPEYSLAKDFQNAYNAIIEICEKNAFVKSTDTIHKHLVTTVNETQEKIYSLPIEPAYKYGTIAALQIGKKAEELAYNLGAHPISTIVNFVQDTGKVMYHMGRLICTDWEFALEHPELSPQAQQDLNKISQIVESFYNLSSLDKFKLGIDTAFDIKIQTKLCQSIGKISGGLKQASQELTFLQKAECIANSPERLQQIQKLIQVLKKQENGIERFRSSLINLAIKREKEFLAASTQLPRTIEHAVKEFNLRVARLTMQYGKETVNEAVSLFNTSENGLLKNVLTCEKLEEITQGLQKINSNPRWEKFKYDAAHKNKVTLNSVREAMAAIACEEQGLIPSLIRPIKEEGADFFEAVSKQNWDVKSPTSFTLEGKPIFNLDFFIDLIQTNLRNNPAEKIILNISELTVEDFLKLKNTLISQFEPNTLKKIIVVNMKNPGSSIIKLT